MKTLLRALSILIFALLAEACVPAGAPEAPRPASRQPIVGGEELKTIDPRAAHVVMLRTIRDGQIEICTGTFISESAILTAGHCVNDDPAKMAAIYALQPFVQNEVTEVAITKIVRHENYKANARHPNDLAIVFFRGGLPPGARVADFHAPGVALDRLSLFVLGYGRTEGREDSSQAVREEGILRGVRLQNEDLWLKEETIEARQDSGRGVCFGDSGGPALYETSNKTYVVAVVSGGGNELRTGIDQCLLPSLFMRVSFFQRWIERTLVENRTTGRTSRDSVGSLETTAR